MRIREIKSAFRAYPSPLSVLNLLRMIRVAITPQGRLLKTRLSNGAIIYGKNRPGFGGRGVYIFRDSLEPEFYYLEKLLDRSGVFVDVGASTGIYTIKAALHYGDSGLVLSLEPFPDVFATLCYNIQANNLSNVRLRNICAGAVTGEGSLWLNSNRPNLFSLHRDDPRAQSMRTLTVALDDLFKLEKLSRLDYLKIDVEGAEQEILNGARSIIKQYRPIIQTEMIMKDFLLKLPSYTVFRAPNSPNKIHVPNEHQKILLPINLGWNKIQ